MDDVRSILSGFDRALAAGDAAAMGELFSADGQLLLLYQEPIVGREAIIAFWGEIFDANDTSAWDQEYLVLDQHAERAYVLSDYEETMAPRVGGPRMHIRGRAVYFLRREAMDGWRIWLALNSHRRPVEEVT